MLTFKFKTLVRALLTALAVTCAGSASAAAPIRWQPAFDPRMHVSPPLGKGPDGFGAQVRVDPAFKIAEAAAVGPVLEAETAGIVRVGEVLVVPGDAESVGMVGTRFGIDPTALRNITRKAIAFAGDHFEIITLWVTFDDRGTDALAYALNVRNEVAGLGRRLRQQDFSAAYGSAGTLRTVVNMKSLGLSSGELRANWGTALETWGQETGHRYMAFLDVRDPRTQRSSDLLLGRDCAHFDWFLDTQASVQDGLAWQDNGDGSFTWTEQNKRYGNLDLYGMGLLAADEVPNFFAITNIPNYTRLPCEQQSPGRIPAQRTVTGTRLDLSIADVVAANGPREPAISTGYLRELQVVVTRPNETVDSTIAQGLARRIDEARKWWEEWALNASRNRLLVCTQSTADCGDARSDVVVVETMPPAIPAQGPVGFRIDVANAGARTATGIKAWVEVTAGGTKFSSGEPRVLADLAAGATRSESFSVALGPLPCGSQAVVVARTQSDVHYHRLTVSRPLGMEVAWREDFEGETGWVVNPEGTDEGIGATWQRGTPELSFVVDRQTQPAGAHGGAGAFVTGLIPPDPGRGGGFVRGGRVTLQSPVIPSTGLRNPQLHYHATVSAMEAASAGTVGTSTRAYLSVLVRAANTAGADAGADNPWREIDRISNQISFIWQERVVALPPDLDLSAGIELRFVAADENVEPPGGIEAAVDDLSLLSNVAACEVADTDNGCGCRMGGRAPGPRTGFSFVALAALALFARRQRRSRAATLSRFR